MKKAPAAATMATKPWPTARTLAAPLNDEGVAELIGLGTAAVWTTAAAPGAGDEELPPTGYGVDTAGEAAAVVGGAEVWAVMTIALALLLALPVVETWLSVLSPGAEDKEVGAEAMEPVATHGKVEI